MTQFTELPNWTNLTRKISFLEITGEISEYLIQRAYKLGIAATEDNALYLGGVGFWLKEATVNGTFCTNLIYNSHPKDWNVNSIISELEFKKFEIYRQYGVI